MAGLFSLAAVVLWVLAALAGFGWLVHLDALQILGCIAAGLVCMAVSSVAKARPWA